MIAEEEARGEVRGQEAEVRKRAPEGWPGRCKSSKELDRFTDQMGNYLDWQEQSKSFEWLPL